MSGYNHIVGGTVFTGIFLSMYDVNIFSQPIYLFFTAFFAVLPDIDHTKAPIGKMFYPLARYLDRKYGHRTITHSLLCYLILFFFIGLIEKTMSTATIITSIFLWSFGSHLIFDMVTKQGVPLLYPFMKNACVIPANPQYRFKSSEMKTEATIFVFFIFLGFSCKNLFANGFWNNYNRQFNNIKHIVNEQRVYDGILNIKYEIKKDGIGQKGSGILIQSNNESLIIFNNGFKEINKKDRIITLIPERQKRHLIQKSIYFNDIIGDSLRKIIKDKMIIKLKADTEIPVSYLKEDIRINSKDLDLEFVYNPVFKSNNIDTIDAQIEKEINLLQEEISTKKEQEQYKKMENYQMEKQIEVALRRLNSLTNQVNSEDLYIKEQAIKQLDGAQKEYEQLTKSKGYLTQNHSEMIRMKYLKSKLHIRKKNNYTGFFKYAEIKE